MDIQSDDRKALPRCFYCDSYMTFCMPRDKEDDDYMLPLRCSGCGFYYFDGMAYTCKGCYLWVEKSCSELPKEIGKHPFHSAHSLCLQYLPFPESYFICDGCHDMCYGLNYFCKWCRFFLGTKCSCLTYKEAEASKCAQAETTLLHFSHHHQLTWCSVMEELGIYCRACKEVILGAAYACTRCIFILHESCLNDMPQEVEHPFHPQHHLLPEPMVGMHSSKKCNACCEKIWGINFGCDDCSFYLHASCVKYRTRAIKHQFHEHDLLYFGPKNIDRCCKCHFCGEDCNVSFFCCIICQVDIHLECLPLPVAVKHSRHFHPLTLQDMVIDSLGQHYCDICETERNPEHHVYYCDECNYTSHIDCVISQIEPPEEILAYLIPRSKKMELNQEKIEKSSKIVYSEAKEVSDAYTFGEKLGLIEPNDEDNDVGNYNVTAKENFVAEKENNLEEVASNQELIDAKQSGNAEKEGDTTDSFQAFLKYIGLHQTTLKEEIKILQEKVEELTAKLVAVQVKLKKIVDPSSLLPSPKTTRKIQHFSHHHTLIFCILSDQEYHRCEGCGYKIRGPAYVCEDECFFCLHKSCSELPGEIRKHPLHPSHPLLIQNYGFGERDHDFWKCDGCQEVSGGQKYICKWCRFSLDIKCAFLSDEEAEALKGYNLVKTTILHFSHRHHLIRCSLTDGFKSCNGCKAALSGPTYACLVCNFFIHESCLDDMPQEVKTLFHPQHHLLPQPMLDKFPYKKCNGCHEVIWGISFTCEDCSFYLHISCAKYQTRALKHEFHEHDLLYFGQRNIGRCRKCSSCGKSCQTSFFCCIICQVDIHLECLPLPLMVKHNRHFHPLTLTLGDSIVEDDLGGYYCDICETKRNPKHHIYYCNECNYPAHIDCVISQDEPPEEILSYLIPQTNEVASKDEIDEKESKVCDLKANEGDDIYQYQIENLEEEEEGLIGSLELVQAKLKKRTKELSDLM